MSLSWTVPAKADLFEFMAYKISFLFGNEDSTWDAWVTSINAGTPSAAETAAIAKFSGKTISVYINEGFLDGFDMSSYEYVTKWSGGCLEDYSSQVGGFCLLETNDTDMTGTSDTLALIYPSAPTVSGGSSNRDMQIYRINKTEMDAFAGLWVSETIVDTSTNE
jgi:hypothetical protein